MIILGYYFLIFEITAFSTRMYQKYRNKNETGHFLICMYSFSLILFFTDDHRILVEPACGASLAAVYGDVIHNLQNESKLGPVKSALVIVCGGSSVTLAQLEKWKDMFNL